MRGLDALAAACAPAETNETTPAPVALNDEQCEKIAAIVVKQLQGQQQKTDTEDPAEDPAEEEGESEDGEGNA